MNEKFNNMSREEAIELLKEIADWTEQSISYLSTRTDWARGYRDGIFQAKDIVRNIINK
jgi:hypothetical protein